ncbi:M50 family metallopeptidase [Woodsholea maritima]|uniref:M50 family metallopeptidase n=1 Tax=Woodsholea maritima TaxID=240237 RepID=UPI00037810E4|nr:M50 family metallopeptidase [Woodsholea maritima]
MQDILGSGLIGIFTFLIVMSFVVVIHELGHYWAGRLCGVHAEAFSLGFGPKLFGIYDKHGTCWQVSAFPLGGYVRFLGDENAAGAPDRETLERLRAERGPDADKVMHFKPVWQRAFITAAGPLANFVLAIVIFSVFGAVVGEERRAPLVGGVIEGGAAEAAGVQAGDLVIAIDGRPIESFDELRQMIALRGARDAVITVNRDGQVIDLQARVNRELRPDGLGGERRMGFLGVELSRDAQRTYKRYSWLEAPLYGVRFTADMVGNILDYIGRIVTGRSGTEQLNGPLGIATTAGQLTTNTLLVDAGEQEVALNQRVGAWVRSLFFFAGLISIGLGLMNLMPIPMLDGGHLVFCAYEAITQRPPSLAVQEMGFKVGLVLVLGILLVATWNDLGYLHGLLTS